MRWRRKNERVSQRKGAGCRTLLLVMLFSLLMSSSVYAEEADDTQGMERIEAQDDTQDTDQNETQNEEQEVKQEEPPAPEIKPRWKNEDGKWYYYDKTGQMVTGWQTIGGSRFYFETNGAAVTGWKELGKCWYYFSRRGIMRTGWQKIGTRWYYLGSNGRVRKGWQQIKGTWYRFSDTGAMQTGWTKSGKAWYFLAADGKMSVGWKKIGKRTYFFQKDGQMTVGWKKLSGKWYFFAKDGVLQKSCWIDRYYVGSDGTWVKSLPDSVKLNVKNILQRPELPMGCEVTSLDIVLQYMGYDIPKGQLSDQFLPKGSSSSTSPYTAFLGNPRSRSSWYCYSPVIVKCANSYLQSVKAKQKAVDLTGTKFEDLFYELDAGRPVVIWGTLSMGSPSTRGSWYVGGRSYPRYINLHCLVLTGYDRKKGVVYVSDPIYGNRSYRLETVKTRYAQMGSQAVVIRDTD